MGESYLAWCAEHWHELDEIWKDELKSVIARKDVRRDGK